jgi:hypothetical protein
MSKKYLSLEEASSFLRMTPAELNKLREKGEIRAFSDRGSWKFREEDVENLSRSRQADSNPELPLLPANEGSDEFVFEDDDEKDEQPTIFRNNPKSSSSSDSDIRLMLDDDSPSSVSDVVLPLADSDSDVKLAGEAPRKTPKRGSDSDVKLVGESGVLAPGSDSDVKLIGAGSDSDVKLIGESAVLAKGPGSDSDVRLANETKAPSPDAKTEQFVLPLPDDEGITLAPFDDEPKTLVQPAPKKPVASKPETGKSVLDDDAFPPLAGDSGISLERVADSGISLDDGSALKLGADSGLSLDLSNDSGISLVGDSTTQTSKAPQKPAAKGDMNVTAPLMDIPLAGDGSDDLIDTNLEIPMVGDSSSEFDSTGVISLGDEDDADEYEQTVIKKGGRPAATQAEIANDEELFDGIDDVMEASDDDDVEVADDVMGEDDEVSADVFGADEEDFSGEVESGESLGEMPVQKYGMIAPMEAEWGAGVFAGVLVGSLMMVCTGIVMFELLRNMWHADIAGVNPVSGGLIDTIAGMF